MADSITIVRVPKELDPFWALDRPVQGRTDRQHPGGSQQGHINHGPKRRLRSAHRGTARIQRLKRSGSGRLWAHAEDTRARGTATPRAAVAKAAKPGMARAERSARATEPRRRPRNRPGAATARSATQAPPTLSPRRAGGLRSARSPPLGTQGAGKPGTAKRNCRGEGRCEHARRSEPAANRESGQGAKPERACDGRGDGAGRPPGLRTVWNITVRDGVVSCASWSVVSNFSVRQRRRASGLNRTSRSGIGDELVTSQALVVWFEETSWSGAW